MMTKKYIYSLMVLCCLSSLQAGSISTKLHETKQYFFTTSKDITTFAFSKTLSLKDQLKSYYTLTKQWTKTAYTLLKTNKKTADQFIKKRGKAAVHQALTLMESKHKKFDPKPREILTYIFLHRDVIEKAIILGLENGKTIADIGLDVAGLVPVAGSSAMMVKLVVLDFMLPILTVTLQMAFKWDQASIEK